jgi:hypothetical protein
MTTSRCPYCDQPLPASADACPACGGSLDTPLAAPPQATAPVASPPPASAQPPPAAQQPPPATAPRYPPRPLPTAPPAKKRPVFLIALFTCLGVFLCILLVFGLIFARRVARQLNLGRSSATPIFEPAISRSMTVDPAQLVETVRILNERAKVLGYSKVDFSINDQGQITGSLPKDVDTQALIKSLTAAGLVELVDLGETTLQPGDTISTDLFITDQSQASGKTYHTLLTGAAFEDADVVRDSTGGYQVTFTLNPEGTQALADYTTANIGSYLAIVLDKVVVSAPKIETAIPDGKGLISGKFTQAQAREIVAMLKSGALPLPLQTVQAVTPTQ